MIVCHCQRISCGDTSAAVEWMRATDPDTVITPRKVYRALGKTPDCGGCMPLFLDQMRRNDKLAVQGASQTRQIPNLKGTIHAGQRQGY